MLAFIPVVAFHVESACFDFPSYKDVVVRASAWASQAFAVARFIRGMCVCVCVNAWTWRQIDAGGTGLSWMPVTKLLQRQGMGGLIDHLYLQARPAQSTPQNAVVSVFGLNDSVRLL